ncbi:MAG TPA: M56 family metallopeptidase [Novosphingobium sp.]|nr:M56 family metallopeptidase [Novosphingobium sp.]
MISWLLDTLIWSGALIALVLVLRRPVARAFGPGVAYALWALPFLRLVLPPLVLPAGFAPAAAASVPAAAGAEVMTITVAAPAEPALVLPWGLLLVSAWLAGAALFLVARWIEYRAMRRALLAGAVTVDVREGVRIVETPQVDAPVAFGLRDKVVALPPRFMISGHIAERALAIEHELAHHRGRDLIANVVAQPLLALHWFNPLAWAAWNAMRRDQEAACDARTMAGRDARTRAAYARVIAAFAAGDRLDSRLGPRIALAAPMTCPVLGDKSIIHRLRSLTMTEISPRRRRAGLWLLAAGTALALPATATVVYAGQDAPDAPVAPVAPVAPAAPAAPAAPTPPKMVKRVMVIHEDADGKHGDAKFERRLERDGKTIVLKSDREISDAELEAKLAKLEAELPRIEALREGVMVDEAGGKRTFVIRRKLGEGEGKDHEAHEFMLRRGPGEGGAVHAIRLGGAACQDGESATAEAEADEGGKKQKVKIRVCSVGEGRGDAIRGLREARARLADDGQLSAETRARILSQLDEAIAKVERGDK